MMINWVIWIGITLESKDLDQVVQVGTVFADFRPYPIGFQAHVNMQSRVNRSGKPLEK